MKKEKKESLQGLKIVFFLLIVLVIVLGILIYFKEVRKQEKVSANIVIPILEGSSEYEFGIDTLALSKEKEREYIFKITNYSKGKMLSENTHYYIDVENHTNHKIALKRNNEEEDLMQGENIMVLESSFSNNKKEEVLYHLYLTSVAEVKSDEFIYVRIVSQKD